MNTTPLWVPLVVAAFGVIGTVVGTISGVLITQRRSDRRERYARQDAVAREHDRWAREDALRTFDDRRDAYISFCEALRAMALVAYDHGMGLSVDTADGRLEEGWQTPAFKCLQHLQVYATARVGTLASQAYSAAWRWGSETRHGRDNEHFYDQQDVYDLAQTELILMVRSDLGVAEDMSRAEPGGSAA